MAAKCLTCGMSADCQYVYATFNPNATYALLHCAGPGVPTDTLYDVINDKRTSQGPELWQSWGYCWSNFFEIVQMKFQGEKIKVCVYEYVHHGIRRFRIILCLNLYVCVYLVV